MIAFINGTLVKTGVATVIVEVQGIGYELLIPDTVRSTLPAAGGRVRLHTYLQVKEDGLSLFGFATEEEKELFCLLISVSGIGPKGALGILSALPADQLRFAVLAKDAKALAKAPGIGKKTAERIIIELQDKFHAEDLLADASSTSTETLPQETGLREEAVQALTALGYSASEALRAVRQATLTEDSTVEELLKQSLRYL